MSTEIKKLEEMTVKVNKKIEKIHTSSYNSSLLAHPSELAEVRKVLDLASKTLKANKVYFENNIEKAGYSSFHLSDTLDILGHILEIINKRNQSAKRQKNKRESSAEKSS
ncbi:MAG: hypothetical protein OQK81_00180 [Candidatus Bathyarchaeota archaeon]|jgi:hypothetical protein|nr:hypothetical protein [Candidatus Bathyarchaeota archaeon]